MSFTLQRSLSLLGSPGSGKGFYGRPLAEAWKVPLFTVSTVLRQVLPSASLDDGKLLDDRTVSEALLDFLRDQSTPYLLDGFPRTLAQVHLMRDHWPTPIDTALHFAVPDFVCTAKMLGRRHCPKCDKSINVAAVHQDGFDLPPQLPDNYPLVCNQDACKWTIRADDTPEIVSERLRLHHAHEDPILRELSHVLSLTPYRGHRDQGMIQERAEAWLSNLTD